MMRFFVLLTATSLAACNGQASAPVSPGAILPATPAASAGVVAQAGVVILSGERAFAAAELGYLTTAAAVGLLVDNGAIAGDTAEWVRTRNAEARRLLVRGKAATDAADQARAAAALFDITRVLDLLREGR